MTLSWDPSIKSEAHPLLHQLVDEFTLFVWLFIQSDTHLKRQVTHWTIKDFTPGPTSEISLISARFELAPFCYLTQHRSITLV